MKRAGDYTEKELRELSEEEISTLIDLECAHEGISLLPDCPEKPVYEQPPFDIEVYEIFGFLFLTPEDAGSLLAAFQKVKAYKTEGSGQSRRIKPIGNDSWNYPKIVPEKIYSVKKWNEICEEVEKNKKTKTEYDRQKSKYDKALGARKDMSEKVWNLVFDARRNEDERNYLRNSFKRYLDLAKNDKEIAMNFLVKANSNIELEEDLIQELCPGYKMPEVEE